MVQLLIIADDLTGAADTGVQFSKRGIPTLVTVDRGIDIMSLDSSIVVLAVDTESRHLSPGEAADQVAKVVRRAASCGVRHFYKKTDSTLRGNVGAELEATMKAAGSDRLIFVSAHPKTGRFTRNGYQYVGNRLLHTTAFGQDPREPVEMSFIPSIIARQSDVATYVISPRSDQAAATLQRGRNGIYAFDCEGCEDLARIGSILAEHAALDVVAGPAGFAELLPELLQLPQKPLAQKKNDWPILLVNGSVNEVALSQVAFARQRGFADIIVPPSVLFLNESASADEVDKIVDEAALESRRPKDVILRTIGGHDELAGYIENSPMPGETDEIFRLAAKNTGRLVCRILTKAEFGNCAVFGGDTALGVMEALGCRRLMLGEEILPGLALSELVGYPRCINFITKAGGFGTEDVVCRIRDFLRKDQP